MRRILSLQASRALFGTIPRILLVAAALAASGFATQWAGPHVPWWVITLAGLILLAGLQYLGSRWLERDVLRAAQDDPGD